jgi:iron complex outermembrane recepter protein
MAACATILSALPAIGADSVQSRPVRVNIAPTDLQSALIELSSQADVQIVMESSEVAGIPSTGLSGEYSVEEALSRLLSGSGLSYRITSPGTITVGRTTATAAPQRTSAAQAPAANIPGERGSAALEEVVVTAQKRVERLQDVPLAVTALGGDALESRQINDTNNLVQAVPSLSYQQGTNPANTSFRIRGIGTSLFGQGVESSVAIVVDGVVAARQAQSFADFADIERIEVLRGPQGTLFGKNATAGVINVVTARPADEFEAKMDVTAAQDDEYRVRGTISGPIADTFGARLTGYYNDVGGNLYNVTTKDKHGGFESYGARVKLEWDATDSLNLLLAGDYRSNNSECCQSVYINAVYPPLAQLNAPVVASRDNRQLTENAVTFFKTEQKTFSLQGDLDLGAITLTSVSAYQDFLVDNNFDVDRVNTAPPIYPGPGNGLNGAIAAFDLNYGEVDLDQFTQELRITSGDDQPLTYVAGLYYMDLGIDRAFFRRRAICATGTLGQPCAAPVYQSVEHTSELSSEHSAAFGQLEYDITDALTALLGARYQYEKVSVTGARTGQPMFPGDQLFPGGTANSGTRSADDTAVTGKAGLQYRFSRNAQVYGTYTRGYKGLGFDTEITANFAAQNPVLPESVDAYELGFKGASDNGIFTIAAAAFLADYTDLQVQANRSDQNTGVISFVQTNAGSSRTRGFEIETTVRPLDGLSIETAATYAKATIDIDGLNCPLQFQAAAPILTGSFPVNSCFRAQLPNAAGVLVTSGPIQNVRGGTLPASPRWRVNLSPRYEHDLGDSNWLGFVQVSANYQSKQGFSVEQNPLFVQESYTLVDASIGIREFHNRYGVTLFVKNLFDKTYFTSFAPGGLLSTATNPFDLYATIPKNADRYFGATVSVSF